MVWRIAVILTFFILNTLKIECKITKYCGIIAIFVPCFEILYELLEDEGFID